MRPKMPEYPKLMDKDRSNYPILIIKGIVFLLIAMFIIQRIEINRQEREVGIEYRAAVEQYEYDVAHYNQTVRNYIKSIDRNYPINTNDSVQVTISISRTRDRSAQKVGEEMSYQYFFNGKPISSGSKVNMYFGKENVIKAVIMDEDPYHDDTGIDEYIFTPSFIEIIDGITENRNVRVHEIYGDYAGNTDIYNITYRINPVKRLNLSPVQRIKYPKYPEMPQNIDYSQIDVPFFATAIKSTYFYLFIGLEVILSLFILKSQNDGIKKENAKRISEYQKEMQIYEQEYKEFEEERKKFISFINGRTLSEVAGVPSDVLFDEKDLPFCRDGGAFGRRFTAYVAKYGGCYHMSRVCGGAENMREVNIVVAKRNFRPCTKCALGAYEANASWYSEYLRLREQCRQFDYIPDSFNKIKVPNM